LHAVRTMDAEGPEAPIKEKHLGRRRTINEGRRGAWAEAGEDWTYTAPASILASDFIQESRGQRDDAINAYLSSHRGARREWAPEQGEEALGIDDEAPEEGPVAKTFHEHFSDLEHVFHGLVTGRAVVTRDRVAADAADLAKRSDAALERHVDSVIEELEDEARYWLKGGIEIDPATGRVDLQPEQRSFADVVREQKERQESMRRRAQELAGGSAHGYDQLEAEVQAVLYQGLPTESAPVLRKENTMQALRADVQNLGDWVTRLQRRGELPELPRPPTRTARVRQIREARQQRLEVQAALQELGAAALAERARLTLLGRERSRPAEFPDWAFRMMSRERQDEVLRYAPQPTKGTREFAYPYPEPAVPIPVLEGNPWPTPHSSCRH